MIAFLKGLIAHKEPALVIVDVGGVGYQVRVSLNTFAALPAENQPCQLLTHLQIKEDAHILYGFLDAIEKRLFLDLLTISGIGGNTALIILSSLTTQELYQALTTEDVRTIQGIKGIGAKTAQRIVLELKDKVRRDSFEENTNVLQELRQQNQAKQEALMALLALGVTKQVAEKNIDLILKKEGNALKVEDLIKLALKM